MKWKCKKTGNVIELPDYEDKNMEGHDGYELVTEPQEDKMVDKKTTKKKEQ